MANQGSIKATVPGFEFVTAGIVKTEQNPDDTEESKVAAPNDDTAILEVDSGTKTSKTRDHSCKICGKHFSSKSSVKRHFVAHLIEKPFHCRVCSASFMRHYHLLAHSKTHSETSELCTGDVSDRIKAEAKSEEHPVSSARQDNIRPLVHRKKIHECSICNMVFSEQSSLNRHKKKHLAEKRFLCQFCTESFPLRRSLVLHIADVHVSETPYSCDFCDSRFVAEHLLRNHLRKSHLMGKTFECEVCCKRLATKYALNEHKRIHTGEKPFACHLCSLDFRYRRNFRLHLANHTKVKLETGLDNNEELSEANTITVRTESGVNNYLRNASDKQLFVCPICNKIFLSRSLLGKHLKIHAIDKPYTCDICSNRYNQRSRLIQHRKVHFLGGTVRPYQCTVCKKAFKDEIQLKAHASAHANVKPFRCEICDKRFAWKYEKDAHKVVHTYEKPHKCKLCQESFKGRRQLRYHMETHQSFNCERCNRKYLSLERLQLHIDKDHEGLVTLVCDICQQGFTSKALLQAHTKMHIEETNKCKECGMSFMSEFGLTLHMRKHTGETQLKCMSCKTFRKPNMKPCLKCAKLNETSAASSVKLLTSFQASLSEEKPQISKLEPA